MLLDCAHTHTHTPSSQYYAHTRTHSDPCEQARRHVPARFTSFHPLSRPQQSHTKLIYIPNNSPIHWVQVQRWAWCNKAGTNIAPDLEKKTPQSSLCGVGEQGTCWGLKSWVLIFRRDRIVSRSLRDEDWKYYEY